jgi:hypothetical protein
MPVDLYRVQVKPDITDNLQYPVPWGVSIAMAKGRCPNLRVGDGFFYFIKDLPAFYLVHDIG